MGLIWELQIQRYHGCAQSLGPNSMEKAPRPPGVIFSGFLFDFLDEFNGFRRTSVPGWGALAWLARLS